MYNNNKYTSQQCVFPGVSHQYQQQPMHTQFDQQKQNNQTIADGKTACSATEHNSGWRVRARRHSVMADNGKVNGSNEGDSDNVTMRWEIIRVCRR